MSRLEAKHPILYLKPAEMYVSDRPSIVQTVLGSCVSVTMFNHRLKMGAICHAMLPHCRHIKCNGVCDERLRYVDCSIRHMLRKFRSLGIGHQEIEVKLFGGADMFTAGVGERESVGAQNTKTTLRVIEKEHLNLCKMDTGGDQGRKIFFHTHTGEIFLKHLGKGKGKLTADVLKAENQIRIAELGKSRQDRARDSMRLARGSMHMLKFHPAGGFSGVR